MSQTPLARFARLSLLGLVLVSGLGAMADGFPFSPALPPPLGRIDIAVAGADPAEVYVDGELQSDHTPAIITVPAGEVTVTLKKRGYADFVRTLIVEPLATVPLRAEMTPQ